LLGVFLLKLPRTHHVQLRYWAHTSYQHVGPHYRGVPCAVTETALRSGALARTGLDAKLYWIRESIQGNVKHNECLPKTVRERIFILAWILYSHSERVSVGAGSCSGCARFDSGPLHQVFRDFPHASQDNSRIELPIVHRRFIQNWRKRHSFGIITHAWKETVTKCDSDTYNDGYYRSLRATGRDTKEHYTY
jgi:hypothetical protein